MKKVIKINSLFIISFLFVGLFMLNTSLIYSQVDFGTAREGLSYTFDMEDGTNACAIAWNSKKQLYYAVIAGNMDYPLEVFGVSGAIQYSGEAGFDFRGLWYNDKTGKIEGNGLEPGTENHGLVSLDLDPTALPTGTVKNITTAEIQPEFNSVGCYDSKKKQVVYYNNGSLYFYARKAMKGDKEPNYSVTEIAGLPCEIEEINETSVVYTGRNGYEYGVFDYSSGIMYLINRAGNVTGQVAFPEGAPAMDRFGFSYANGLVWLYDVDARTWYSYSF